MPNAIMNGAVPSWVAQPQSSMVLPGGFQSMPAAPQNVGISPNVGAPPKPGSSGNPTNPNSWDGIGPDTNQNQISNNGNPMNAASINSNFNPQQLQMMQMYAGQGFNGLQSVNGNPFGNVNPWGMNSGQGIYGNG